MEPSKRILVIGGGFSGLACIKSLKEEGVDPVCYEKTSQSGGLWQYRDDPLHGVPSIMPTTVINHSKEMGTFSDFVPDKSYPNYMRHEDLLKFFNDLGQAFDCFRHIVHNREVLQVKRAADYDATGRWDVESRDVATGALRREAFDGVLVCVGLNTHPKMAAFPGMERFRGSVLHSHDLKAVDAFRGKRVVVVGAGCSALDAAVEVSNVASQVYLSTRTGAWVVPRVGPYGLPFDFAMIRRFGALLHSWLGWRFTSWYYERFFVEPRFNHRLYNLRPRHPALARDPLTNDLLPAKVITGAVKVRRDVERFTETGVVFENASEETEVDAVVLATGYRWSFPFLEEGTVRADGSGGAVHLYKCMWPAHLQHPTLALVGFFLPNGPGFPISEMQARWAAKVFRGRCLPPEEAQMVADARRRHAENAGRYLPSDKTSVRVDSVQFLDELAEQFGARPRLGRLLITDPRLFWALMFGPALPYQYRLQGPHAWKGARKAILTAYDRVRYPFSEGDPRTYEKSGKWNSWLVLRLILALLVLALWASQAEISAKCFVLALVLPCVVAAKGFYRKYVVLSLLLPFYVPWEGFVASYLVTLFVPLLFASLN